MKKIVYILILLFVFTGCHHSKKTARKNTSTNDTKQQVINTPTTRENKQDTIKITQTPALQQKEKPFQTYTSKVSGSYKSIPFSATVRIAYDSIIWVSATSFGIEGVRALLTKDSVFVINKMEKEFISIPYSKANSLIGMPIDYDFVQSMFTDSVQNVVLNSPKCKGNIKKLSMKVDNKYWLPYEIDVNALLGSQEQKIKLKVKNHKINTILSYPFEKPSNYKLRN